MPKTLRFQWGDETLDFQFSKIDRAKLYGFKKVEVIDSDGDTCDLATLADDGSTVIGRGGTGMGYLDADGLWREKSDLTPVDLDGKEIQAVESSFSAPIKLFETVSAEIYLEHNIRLVYELDSDAAPESLTDQLNDGVIFSFPYSYRGGLEADAGFLLIGADGNLFLCVGDPTVPEFIGIQEASAPEEDVDEMEDDLMNFDMI